MVSKHFFFKLSDFLGILTFMIKRLFRNMVYTFQNGKWFHEKFHFEIYVWLYLQQWPMKGPWQLNWSLVPQQTNLQFLDWIQDQLSVAAHPELMHSCTLPVLSLRLLLSFFFTHSNLCTLTGFFPSPSPSWALALTSGLTHIDSVGTHPYSPHC